MTGTLKIPIHNQDDLRELLIEEFLKGKDNIQPDEKFVHYTDAETAMKIIKNKEVWLRNAQVMNDASEISYGLSYFKKALFENDALGVLAEAESVIGSEPIQQELKSRLQAYDRFLQQETYLACLSRHQSCEDETGRLSMWRAYGNVAIVIRSTPFTFDRPIERNAPLSVSVNYFDKDDYASHLSNIASKLRERAADLKAANINREGMIQALIELAYNVAVCTKHSGFLEEQELRVIWHPLSMSNPHMKPKQVVINGVAQTIWALNLVNDPENGLDRADLPNLLERIIIGPTAHPQVSYSAFVECLKSVRVPEPENKVVVSHIPLRQ